MSMLAAVRGQRVITRPKTDSTLPTRYGRVAGTVIGPARRADRVMVRLDMYNEAVSVRMADLDPEEGH